MTAIATGRDDGLDGLVGRAGAIRRRRRRGLAAAAAVLAAASAPFPAASLASFRITTQGNVLVTISLRPGTQPTAAHASSVPASIPVT